MKYASKRRTVLAGWLLALSFLLSAYATTAAAQQTASVVASHAKYGKHAVYYSRHRMGRVACIRVMQGYKINGLDKEFCRKVMARKALVSEAQEYKYAAITGRGSCSTIGSWWWVSVNGGKEERKQQVDCSHPEDVAHHLRVGRVAEVPYIVAKTYGFALEGHAPARVRRAY